MKNSLAELSPDSVVAQKFEALVRRFCLNARQLGSELVPSYNDFQKFRSLDVQKQEELLAAFKSFYKILMTCVAEGADVRDSRSTVWWAIKELGLRPPSDLFGCLEKDDVFEIYNSEHIQIFRSFNFFDLTSYSVEDIFSYPWLELYSRPGAITEAMVSTITQVLSGTGGNVVETNFPLHTVTCKFAPGKEWSTIQHKVFACLKSKSNQKFLFNAFKVTDQNISQA